MFEGPPTLFAPETQDLNMNNFMTLATRLDELCRIPPKFLYLAETSCGRAQLAIVRPSL